MESIKHLIITVCLCLGFLLGNVLVDIDHKGKIGDKIKAFFGDNVYLEKGVLHNKVVIISLSVFFIGLGFGLLIHYIGDFI